MRCPIGPVGGVGSGPHLAGAMGKPVWLLNRYDTCWRWLLNRADSPWYPSVRLFRQPAPGDWDSVMRALANALGDWRRSGVARLKPPCVSDTPGA